MLPATSLPSACCSGQLSPGLGCDSSGTALSMSLHLPGLSLLPPPSLISPLSPAGALQEMLCVSGRKLWFVSLDYITIAPSEPKEQKTEEAQQCLHGRDSGDGHKGELGCSHNHV